jgi:hypothetical protein
MECSVYTIWDTEGLKVVFDTSSLHHIVSTALVSATSGKTVTP